MIDVFGTPAFKKGDRVRISVLGALQRRETTLQDESAEKSLRYDGLIGRVVDLTFSGLGDDEIIYHVQIDGICLMLPEDFLSSCQTTNSSGGPSSENLRGGTDRGRGARN